jgi:8-amino-7-oxononanoate synthase
MNLQSFIQKNEEIKATGLFRKARIHGKYTQDFSSNSYLSLHNKLIARLKMAYFILRYGFGGCSSKYVSGFSQIHQNLENAVANYYQKENALLFASGYMASIGILQGLVNSKTIILADRLIHASWIDGILLTKAKFARYSHDNLAELEALLLKYHLKFDRIIILTETVFSMHGTVINLQKYTTLAKKHNAILITDHAHSHGVLKYSNENYDFHIIMGTFSKACGSIGGYVCGKTEILENIANLARTQIYSTSLPNYLTAYNLWAFNYCITNAGKSLKKAEKFAKNNNLEFKGSAILINTFNTNEEAFAFQAQLLKKGIFAPVIRKPTVEKPIVRFCFGGK